MAAALAAEQVGCSVLLAERNDCLGGVLPQCVHTGFGLGRFGENLTGPAYAARFTGRVAASSVCVCTGTTVLRLTSQKTAVLSSADGLTAVRFDRCLLATGCRERSIGSLPVAGTRPAGIFPAGAAQKLVNLGHYEIGEKIIILGSGDVGQIMARQLVLLGKQIVAMIEQRAQLGGLARNRRDCIEAFRIPVILNATISEIMGSERISGVVVRHLDSETYEPLACDTLVTSLGLIPERELIADFEAAGSLPDWLSLCGNCDFIHEIVDTVTAQAERLGAACGKE